MTKRKLEGPELMMLLPVAALADSMIAPFWQQTRRSAQELLLGTLLAAPLLWALLTLYCKRRGAVKAHWTDGPLLAVLLLSAAMELLQCQRFYLHVMSGELSLFWFLALSLSVAAYGNSLSEGTLGRTAQILLFFVLAALVLTLLSASGQMHTVNLRCMPPERLKIGQSALRRAVLLPEYLLLPVLAADKDRRAGQHRSAAWLLGTVFGADALLMLVSELVMGGLAFRITEPVYTLVRLGGLSVFRRMDALHVCVWLLLFYLKLSLYFWAAGRLCAGHCKRAGRQTVFCVAALLVLALFALIVRMDWARVVLVQQTLLWALLLMPGKRERTRA